MFGLELHKFLLSNFSRKANTTMEINELYELPLEIGGKKTYGEHIKNCVDGCAACKMLRRFESHCKKNQRAEIAGVTMDKVHIFQQMSSDDEDIRHWYPDRLEALDGKGGITLDAYFNLKGHGFNDTQIVRYFHISSKIFRDFKDENVPGWKSNDEKYEPAIIAAMKRYDLEHPNH